MARACPSVPSQSMPRSIESAIKASESVAISTEQYQHPDGQRKDSTPRGGGAKCHRRIALRVLPRTAHNGRLARDGVTYYNLRMLLSFFQPRPRICVAAVRRRVAAARVIVCLTLAAVVVFASSAGMLADSGQDTSPDEGPRLLMVEAPGCPYCHRFNRDVAPGYANSDIGAHVPLVRMQLRGPIPDGITLNSRPALTPTFILLGADGVELDRLIGYPGVDFFWGYLERMLRNLPEGTLPVPVPPGTGNG